MADVTLIDAVSTFLGFDIETTLDIARRAPRSYKRYSIEKKHGGRRVIHHPSKQTKAVQHALMETVLAKLTIHDSAVAYRRGKPSPIRTNAETHAPFSFSIRIDFKDFFPSIQPKDLFTAIQRDGTLTLNPVEMSFLSDALFVQVDRRTKGLAIGAPSSPMVSNIVMCGLDIKIAKIGAAVSKPSVYTRYADDIVFSTNEKGACGRFYKRVVSLIRRTESPHLTLNDLKTIYQSRATRRTVTGLYVTPNHKVSIGRTKKRYLKKLVFDFKSGKLAEKDIASLQGHLAYILDVEPAFYNNLVIKYGSDVLHRILAV